MKRKSMVISSSILAALLALGSAGVHANPMGGCGKGGMHAGSQGEYGRHGGMHMERMGAMLNLTDEQREKMRTMKQTHQQATQEKRQAMSELRGQLREAAMSDKFDERKVRKLSGDQAKLSAELTELRTRHFHEFYNSLTPEQQQKMREMREMRGKRGDRS